MSSEMAWQKSSFSGGGGEQCVEIAVAAGAILLREGDTPRAVASAAPSRFRALLERTKAGAYDR
ncbi:DUF397 domain-containing protein [Streptomyces sp. NPDC049577]|uniref:DUF397 domain-containing protein n=1 Tax=Streptomyces sp. NPDC049577 TaxID=3155153 RepID=UPI0034164CCB